VIKTARTSNQVVEIDSITWHVRRGRSKWNGAVLFYAPLARKESGRWNV